MHRLWLVLAFASVLGCGGGGNVQPDATVTSVAVTLQSPLRMGQTAQASGIATLSNGQTQAVTSGWQSDAPAVASVTGSGLVTGIANGRATIYTLSGGRQGQQLLRVTPDYHGGWEGGLRVTSCADSGIFEQEDFCVGEVGTVYEFSLSLNQSGESVNARASYGEDVNFPAVTAPIGADGTTSFTSNLQVTVEGVTLTAEATFQLNSTRVGDLSGTVTELWKIPNIRGEVRLVQDIVNARRNSVNPLDEPLDAPSSKLNPFRRLRPYGGSGDN